jgi:recombination protein RecT
MSDLATTIKTKSAAAPTVRDTLSRMEGEFARALPKHIPVERFLRLAFTELSKTPRLTQCTTPSLLGALMSAAQLGLEPGPLGHFYLTPRSLKGTYQVVPIIGYKGMVELARRSGQLSSIEARPVKANDLFEFEYGLTERLVHRPLMDGDRGETVAFYGVAKFKDGGHVFEVMSRADVDERRDRGAAGKSGPWATDYDAMGSKTVIRALQRWLPQSPEMALALAVDEQPQTWAPGMPVAQVHDDPAVDFSTGEVIEGTIINEGP